MLLRILEVDRGPFAKAKAFYLEVLIELLEDEEGVGYADRTVEESAAWSNLVWWMFGDEAGE